VTVLLCHREPSYLINRFGQLDSLLHRILLPNLIDRRTLIMRFLNIDSLIFIEFALETSADVVGPNVDFGEGDLSFMKCDARLCRSANGRGEITIDKPVVPSLGSAAKGY
jgi:hypothetical protein